MADDAIHRGYILDRDVEPRGAHRQSGQAYVGEAGRIAMATCAGARIVG